MSTIPNLIPEDPEQLEAIHRQILEEAQQQRFVEAVQELSGHAIELTDGNKAAAMDMLLTAVGTLASTMDQPQRKRAAGVFKAYAEHLENMP